MAELHDRFRTLDRINAPDLWSEIERRGADQAPALAVEVRRQTAPITRTDRGPSPTWRLVLLAAVVMLATAIAVVGAGGLFNSSTPFPSTGPVTVMPSATITPSASPTPDLASQPGLILLEGSFSRPAGEPVWLVRPDGTDLHRFAPGSRTIDLNFLQLTRASWSIDGRQIVLMTNWSDKHENDLFIASVDGSGLHAVSDADWANIPGGRPTYGSDGGLAVDGKTLPGGSWSLDQQHVVRVGTERTVGGCPPGPDRTCQVSRLYVTDVADGAVHELPVTPELCLAEPHWSPDGAFIVATSGRPPITGGPCKGVATGLHDLYVIRSDGTGLTQLTSDHDSAWGTWTPDGAHIVYTHLGGLWIIDPDGQHARSLAPALADLSAIVGPDLLTGSVAAGVHAAWQPQP